MPIMQTYDPGSERVLVVPIEEPIPCYVTTSHEANIDGMEDYIVCTFPPREDQYEDLIALQKEVGDPITVAEMALESGLAGEGNVKQFLRYVIVQVEEYMDDKRNFIKERKQCLS